MLPGTVLDGKYRIESILGAGGFGITYEAYDARLASTVAIKEYFPSQFGLRDSTHSVRPRSDGDTEIFERLRSSFLREARTLNQFDHPAIVRVLSVFEAYGTAYMVMKYETGLSLKAWLAGLARRPTQEELDQLVVPLLDALELLHNGAFIHRDIAPDNIIVRADGTPVLLDFGASRRVMSEMTGTLTGVVKKGYSPQEQYATDSRSQGPWTDIYALGATLYRCISGVTPEEATQRVFDDRLLSAAEAGGGNYRPEFLRAIDAAMIVRPSSRPQTVAEWRKMLFADVRPARKPLHEATAATRPNDDGGLAPTRLATPPAHRASESGNVGQPYGGVAAAPTAAPRRKIAIAAVAAGVVAIFGGALALTVSKQFSSSTASVQPTTIADGRSAAARPQVEREPVQPAVRETPGPSSADTRRRFEEEERARLQEAEEARKRQFAADAEARRRSEELQRQQEQIEQLKLEAARRTKELERLRLEEELRQRRLAEDAQSRRQADEALRLQQEQAEALKRQAALSGSQAERQRLEDEARNLKPIDQLLSNQTDRKAEVCREEAERLKAITARGPTARPQLVALSATAQCPEIKEKAQNQLKARTVNLPTPAKPVERPKTQRENRSSGSAPTSQPLSGKCRRETWLECQGRINPRDAALCDTELRMWKC